MINWIVVGIVSLFITVFGHAATPEQVIDRTQDKVVKIGIVSAKRQGVCSGALVSSNGLVLTCAHCFTQGYTKLFVKTDNGVVYNTELVLLDTDKDLALVKIMAHTPY